MPGTTNRAMLQSDREAPDPAATAVAGMRALAALDDLPVGAVLLRPLRDASGGVVDFVFDYVNAWAGYAAGMPISSAAGPARPRGPVGGAAARSSTRSSSCS